MEEFDLINWLERTMKSGGYEALRKFQTKRVQQFVEGCVTKDVEQREADYARGAIEGYSCDIFAELKNELLTERELKQAEQREKENGAN